MTTAIRIARAADVPTILRFIRALAEYEKLLDQVVADEAALRATLFGARPAAEILIAELDHTAPPFGSAAVAGQARDVAGAPVGFALFFQSYSTFLAKPGLYLEDLFVLPEARGHGVGGALMAACAKLAVERGYGRFDWSVLDWNTPALEFYRALGAIELSDWKVLRLVGAPLAALAAKAH